MKIRLLIITMHGRTKCSVDLDLDRRETEIDFASGMKRLTFELSLTKIKNKNKITGKNKTNTGFQ